MMEYSFPIASYDFTICESVLEYEYHNFFQVTIPTFTIKVEEFGVLPLWVLGYN